MYYVYILYVYTICICVYIYIYICVYNIYIYICQIDCQVHVTMSEKMSAYMSDECEHVRLNARKGSAYTSGTKSQHASDRISE